MFSSKQSFSFPFIPPGWHHHVSPAAASLTAPRRCVVPCFTKSVGTQPTKVSKVRIANQRRSFFALRVMAHCYDRLLKAYMIYCGIPMSKILLWDALGTVSVFHLYCSIFAFGHLWFGFGKICVFNKGTQNMFYQLFFIQRAQWLFYQWSFVTSKGLRAQRNFDLQKSNGPATNHVTNHCRYCFWKIWICHL